MNKTIGIRLDEKTEQLLESYMARYGLSSKGLAVRHIVEERLTQEEERDLLEPLFERIEERMAKVSSRGTKAAIASLCLLSAKEDTAMNSKLETMPAGKVFDYAWDMAGTLMTHGERPDFYKASKHSSLMRARNKTKEEALLNEVEQISSASIIKALDETDIASWFESMKIYRETFTFIEGTPGEASDKWLAAFKAYAQATKTLLEILYRMDIYSEDDTELLNEGDMVFSYEKGWFDYSKDTGERLLRDSRRVCHYSTILDVNDPNFRIYDDTEHYTCWNDVLQVREATNAN